MRIKTTFLPALLLFCCAVAQAQTTATFENIPFPVAINFRNDAASSNGVFASGNVALPNEYNTQFQYWEGWAISKETDNTTPGFNNQYSAITGKGVDNSANYALCYTYAGTAMRLTGPAKGGVVNGLYVTNSTYAYFSMLEGDAFAKKFGGITGNDPDFFKLTVKKYRNGQISADSVDFFLADYRSANNANDYIVNDWRFVDLTSLGNADSLVFFLSSSDNGTFGMNTPAYFCADNVITADMPVSVAEAVAAPAFDVAPNPATDVVVLRTEEAGMAAVTDVLGRTVAEILVQPGTNPISCGTWGRGMYTIRFRETARTVMVR